MIRTPRQQYLSRDAALQTERSSWISHWRDLYDYMAPRTPRFLVTDANKGGRRNDKIINLTPVRAAGILAAGMMTSITSPARKWARFTIPDPALAERRNVRSWLDLTERRVFEVIARSNIYSALAAVYLDMAIPGVTAMYVEEDAQDVVRAYLFPIGSYCLANSARLSVDTIYRRFRMTVAQMVEKFGLEACSQPVREAWNRGSRDEWHEVLHVIEPNPEADRRFMDAGSKPWRSVWMETSAPDEARGVLHKSGYDEFPCMCPRWGATGEDVYAYSPGMNALGDARALQVYEKEAAKAAQKWVTPPMKAPTNARNARLGLVPGDIGYVDEGAGGKFEPVYQIDPRGIEYLEAKITRIEQRIHSAFYADLFLALLESDRRQITAEEVRARQQEKMLQLGPVLERLNDELLDPLIDRVFAIMLRAGQIPPPPRELAGQPIRIEYLSILSQAQKALGTTSIERLLATTAQIANVYPDVLDKVDFDRVLDDLGEMMGVPPEELRAKEDVECMRAERARQQQAAQQGEALVAATQGARNLAGADTGGDNALTRILGSMGPQAAAAAPEEMP